jgi:hypothetical protein
VQADEYGEAVAMGRDNEEVAELMRRHCRHARIELVNGNSPVGEALGLPMGLLEVRCKHAPAPLTQGPQARELAIEFYGENCPDCPFRDGTGELPNLATVAAQRAGEIEAARGARQTLIEERARRHRDRREHRHRMLAGEGHVVRDLGDSIDRIDRAEERTGPPGADEERAERNVLDTARAAPHLFRPVLVDSLVELAADVADPTALQALDALVRSGHCPPRRALDAARAVLTRQRSLEAGRLLALLEPELRPSDLSAVLDQLIDLASAVDLVMWERPVSRDGLVAASHVDLPAVIDRIIEHLASDDDRTREAGADAARVLIGDDPTRIVALGPPVAASVRGPGRGYAGYPHPTSAALRALAEGWRGEPALTRRIVEDAAAVASQLVKDELSRVPWFLQRFGEPWEASAPATSEAVTFVVQRASVDWGEESADHAADHLLNLAREIPDALAPHVHALLGAILPLCATNRNALALDVQAGMPPVLAALEQEGLRIRRNARRRRLAGAVGRCASADPSGVLAAVHDLFSASTGDEGHDRAVRTTMLDVLEEAVSPATLRDILPITYSALLDADQGVRSAGIDLWAACARVADALPDELAALAQPLLADNFVVVHRRMLDKLPYLHLPAELAPSLVELVAGWVQTYAAQGPPQSDVLGHAIQALRSLARQLDDETQVTAWFGVALAFVDRCGPHERERLLSAWWPDELRGHPTWTRAALATAASPELVDYYNQRHEPMLEALMDRPQLLAGVAFGEIEPLSTLHGPLHPWRALESVELLQAAGRWADATAIARGVESGQPPGTEGAYGRLLGGTVARAAELSHALTSDGAPPGDLANLLRAVSTSMRDLEASLPDGVSAGRLRHTLDGITASSTAARVLLDQVVVDAAAAAEDLDGAAESLAAIPGGHASGTQRQQIARAWRIAATLLRYDAAIRSARPDGTTLLQSAQRQAEVFGAELENESNGLVPDGLTAFVTAVKAIDGPGTAQLAWQRLGCVPTPVSLVGTDLVPRRFAMGPAGAEPAEPPRAVCVATMRGVPVTDIVVLRRDEVYQLGMTVRLLAVPRWAETCVVEPVTMLGREALALPRYELPICDGVSDEFGITVVGNAPLHCGVEQPIRGPALDCPMQARLVGNGHDEVIQVAGLQRLRVRPFDPSRDVLTEHEQTDHRLLKMFAALDSPDFDTEDVRAFCRLFAACVRAAHVIMFEKTFRRGARVTEGDFHDELERLLSDDPELGGRLTRRDAVAGGFDDLLHDDVIAELKVSRGAPATVDNAIHYLGQPTQYAVGRGSQLSALVVFDHGGKEAPVGVIDNYMDWLRPSLHGLSDPRYPSLVGVLIVNTNLPIPSAWSRRSIEGNEWHQRTRWGYARSRPLTRDDAGSVDAAAVHWAPS